MTSFSIPSTRAIVRNLFRHDPAIYWTDFVVCLVVAYTAAGIYVTAAWFTATQAVAFLVAIFALFRLGSFIHELVHMPDGVVPGFRAAWNVLAGIPMLAPSFFYRNHIDHHKAHGYGTGGDGEYLPLAHGRPRDIVDFMAQSLYLPAAVVLRFGVLTPVSILHPGLRRWTLRYASSFVLNLRYCRMSVESPHPSWIWLELGCCISVHAAWLLPALGLAPWSRLPALYLLGVSTLGLNYVRNLAAHRYRSTGEPMSHLEQLADSVTITGHPLWTELLFPVGARYHALHHLFPTLPYHNLRHAHRRLAAALPADSPYHRTVRSSFRDAWRDLRRDMRAAAASNHAGERRWIERRKQRASS